MTKVYADTGEIVQTHPFGGDKPGGLAFDK